MSDTPSPGPDAMEAPKTRSVDLSIQIGAPPDAVWSAISSGEELTRWFSPIGSVVPGEGGTMTVAWAEGSEWTSNIVTWEPGAHLRTEDEIPEGVDVPDGVVVALDYFIEAKGDGTVLRLVNSGFSADDDWDDYYHSLENGWTFFLWNLKHYLERHPGTPRTMISARPWVSGTKAEVWDRLFGDGGFGESPGPKGEPFRFRVGDRMMDGSAVLSDRPRAFAGKLESLNDGAIHVEMEGSGDRWKMGIWISAYGVDAEECDALRTSLQSQIAHLFPEPS